MASRRRSRNASAAVPQGGHRLRQFFLTVNPELAEAACVDGAEGDCNVESLCPMRGNWDRVNRAIRDALAGVTLADMAMNFQRFEAPARAEARA